MINKSSLSKLLSRRLELLAPAGGMTQFFAAIAAGADAVYCGVGKEFNARRSAENFDEKSFKDACRIAHILGKKVFVTLNIVIKSAEMHSVLALVRRCWLAGADAFIVQDIGLAYEISRLWPDMEIHISTQANIHDRRGVAFCRDVLHATRITLSRELNIQEISHIAKEGVDLEVFGHGALCFCYSGLCYLSSSCGKRSANRGLCAQPCRLPYALVDAKGSLVSAPGRTRPLCPKDRCTIDDLEPLFSSGIASLKLEGRMKSADYVWAVVSAYRFAMDRYRSGGSLTKSEHNRVLTRLRRTFNRGFTDSYLWGEANDDMMSYDRSNNRGELVGKVISSRSLGKVRRYSADKESVKNRMRSYDVFEVMIHLDKPVDAGDLLELKSEINPSDFVTMQVDKDTCANQNLSAKVSRLMPSGSAVRLIRSAQSVAAALRAARLEELPKRPVRISIKSRIGEPFYLKIACADGSFSADAQGFVVECARTKSIYQEELIEHIGRMGTTLFTPVDYSVELDEGVGMSFSALHHIRQDVLKKLEQAILSSYDERVHNTAEAPTAKELHETLAAATDALVQKWQTSSAPFEVCALVTSKAAEKEAKRGGAQRIYSASYAYRSADPSSIAWLDEISREVDAGQLDADIKAKVSVAVSNFSELALAQKKGAYTEITPAIPVHNPSTLLLLQKLGACALWLSSELSLSEIKEISRFAHIPLGVTVYGSIRTMTSEHCILQTIGTCQKKCGTCLYRRQKYRLRDEKGALYPVATDLHGRSRVFAPFCLDLTSQIKELQEVGIKRFMVDCSVLSASDTFSAVSYVCRALKAAQEGKKIPADMSAAQFGHLFSPVD